MKFNKYFWMSAALCFALASCSQDDAVEGNDGQTPTEQVEGTPTWATFKVNIAPSSASSRAAVTEEGTDEEKAVKDVVLLVFKDLEDDKLNTLEAYKTLTVNADGEAQASTFLVSSGHKTVYALANAEALIEQLKLMKLGGAATAGLQLNVTTLNQFKDAVFSLMHDETEPTPVWGTGNIWDNSVLVNGEGNLLMTGVAESTLKEGVSEDDAKKDDFTTNPNNISVDVYRAAAKVQLGFEQDDVLNVANPNDATGGTSIGTLVAGDGNAAYAIFNLNKNSYVLPHTVATNYPMDYNYKWDAYNVNDYFSFTQTVETHTYEALPATTPYNKYVKTVSVLGTADNSTDITNQPYLYIPENMNEQSVKGNTTYALLRTKFTPGDIINVTGYQAGGVGTSAKFGTTASPLITGVSVVPYASGTTSNKGSFLYSMDDNIAFKVDKDKSSITALTGLIAQDDVKLAIQMMAAKMISDANIDAVSTQPDGASSDGLDAKGILPATINVTATEPTTASTAGWYAYVTRSEKNVSALKANDKDATAYFTITVMRVFNNAIYDTEAYTGDKTIVLVPTATKDFGYYSGGECYYRINIEDEAYRGGTDSRRFAVVRNYWYQISISKVNAIGYPNAANAAGEPADALSSDTYVQTNINIPNWTVKPSGPEIGL